MDNELEILKETLRMPYKYIMQPNLRIITFNPTKDLRIFNYSDTGWKRKCFTLQIENDKKQIAKNSTATLRIVSSTTNVPHLERQYNLHWADVDYSPRTIEPQPVDIPKGQRRLDVVFTQKGQKFPGCWISIPFVLYQSDPNKNQAYLPMGTYVVEVKANCENGKGDERKYMISSPMKWDELKINEIDSSPFKSSNSLSTFGKTTITQASSTAASSSSSSSSSSY